MSRSIECKTSILNAVTRIYLGTRTSARIASVEPTILLTWIHTGMQFIYFICCFISSTNEYIEKCVTLSFFSKNVYFRNYSINIFLYKTFYIFTISKVSPSLLCKYCISVEHQLTICFISNKQENKNDLVLLFF